MNPANISRRCRFATLAGIAIVAMPFQCLAGNPKWWYVVDRTADALVVTVSTEALRRDEVLSSAVCEFEISDGSRQKTLRHVRVEVPKEAGVQVEERFPLGISASEKIQGRRMAWKVRVKGSVVGAFPTRGATEGREGLTPPESGTDNGRG